MQCASPDRRGDAARATMGSGRHARQVELSATGWSHFRQQLCTVLALLLVASPKRKRRSLSPRAPRVVVTQYRAIYQEVAWAHHRAPSRPLYEQPVIAPHLTYDVAAR